MKPKEEENPQDHKEKNSRGRNKTPGSKKKPLPPNPLFLESMLSVGKDPWGQLQKLTTLQRFEDHHLFFIRCGSDRKPIRVSQCHLHPVPNSPSIFLFELSNRNSPVYALKWISASASEMIPINFLQNVRDLEEALSSDVAGDLTPRFDFMFVMIQINPSPRIACAGTEAQQMLLAMLQEVDQRDKLLSWSSGVFNILYRSIAASFTGEDLATQLDAFVENVFPAQVPSLFFLLRPSPLF